MNKGVREQLKQVKKAEKEKKTKKRKFRERFKYILKERREKYEERFSLEDRIAHQQKHLENRIKERLNVNVVFQDSATFVYLVNTLIKSGDARLVGESRGCYLYDVPLGEQLFRVVFDPETDCCRTVIPRNEEETQMLA